MVYARMGRLAWRLARPEELANSDCSLVGGYFCRHLSRTLRGLSASSPADQAPRHRRSDCTKLQPLMQAPHVEQLRWLHFEMTLRPEALMTAISIGQTFRVSVHGLLTGHQAEGWDGQHCPAIARNLVALPERLPLITLDVH